MEKKVLKKLTKKNYPMSIQFWYQNRNKKNTHGQ